MSLFQKCLGYTDAHNGELPPFKETDRFVAEQLKEYIDELSNAVIPEFHDRFIITAAYRLLYEARYNMLEPDDKALCDGLVNGSRVISTESEVRL